MNSIERRTDPAAVDRILSRLPDWFGDDAAIRGYVADAATFPSYLAKDADDSVVGVGLVARHFSESAEIHLIAVDPASHRAGIGSRIVQAIEDDLRAEGVRILQVHTVGPSYPSPAYARTREFYQSLGFIPLQEFGGIDWSGPTLVLVKAL